MQNPYVRPEDFVRIWTTSRTLAEVCERLEMAYPTALIRARNYRKKGVALKYFRGRVNAQDLNAVVAQYSQNDGTDKETP